MLPLTLYSLCSSCVPAYSYSHSLSLTKDVHQFLVSLGMKVLLTSAPLCAVYCTVTVIEYCITKYSVV